MNRTPRWVSLLIVLLIAAAAVQAALADTIYFPVMRYDATFTPTATATVTVTPTKTNTPTPTRTPTKTATPNAGLQIMDIVNPDEGSALDEYVVIKNFGSSGQNMTDWFIRDDGPNKYNFPNNYVLGGGKSVKVWTKAGTNDTSNLYWGLTSEVWNNGGDCAYLRDNSDDDNELIDVLCYSLQVGGAIEYYVP